MGSNVVRKLGGAQGERLRAELEEADFEMGSAQHAVWTAKGSGVNVVLYSSGKLLVQGKGADDFASSYLDSPDELLAQSGVAEQDRVDEAVIGSDESGKGDYFGPLVIAGLMVEPQQVGILRTLGVRDSKSVGDAEALRIADQIQQAYPEQTAVVSIGPERYNQLHAKFGRNLNRLLAWGHGTVIEEIRKKQPNCGRALADKFGAERLIRSDLERRGIDIDLEQRVRAESHPAVAGASILARARFLRELRRLGQDVGEKLAKGAGAPVDLVAGALYRSGGIDALRRVAKLHFKTTDKAKLRG